MDITMGNTRLSIIMPCYNVEKTLERAIDSILMQRVDFEYEIIAIDDASTDLTGSILRKYAEKYEKIRILENESNLGNARTFKKGAEASRGDYLCVLDGDDFYTIRDKLQKQVDFLDGDRDGRYAAVAHKYLTVHLDGSIKEDMRLFEPASEHTYLEFIRQHFYCHTSTMMYPNVFKGMEIPILETQRGDTIRTLIAMNATCGRVKILNFVGSAYTVNPEGIWSSLDVEKKKEINIETWKSCEKHAESAKEKRIIRTIVKRIEDAVPMQDKNRPWLINSLIAYLATNWADGIAFKERDLIFRKLYRSDFIDSFCESLGFIRKHILGIKPSANPNQKNIAIVISALNKTGGGIYQEILELITMLRTRKILILLTDMASLDEFTEAVRQDYASFKNLSFAFLKDSPDLLSSIEKTLADMNPSKIYWYCGHNNTNIVSALQDYGAKNIVPFSFDHGLSLGLSNTNIDLVIAKTAKDYKLLSERFGDRAIYIPCWSIPARTERKYMPLDNHNKLNTATAAARFYKYHGETLGSFQSFMVNLMKVTGGKHVHYGPLPNSVEEEIHRALKRNGISPEHFTHVDWSNNLPDSLLEHEVDIFISPFPISSIKLNLQCISAGIPVMVYAGGLTRIEQNDFLNPDVLRWRNRKEFFDTILSLEREKLIELSESGLEYFRTHNALSAAMPYVLFDKCFEPVPIPPKFIDCRIIDTDEVLDLISVVYEDCEIGCQIPTPC